MLFRVAEIYRLAAVALFIAAAGMAAINTAQAQAPGGVEAASSSLPSAPYYLNVTPSSGKFVLSWSAANGNGASVTAYIVYVDGEASLTVGGAARAATLQGLANGVTYNVGVAAQNYRGPGANASASAMPQQGAPLAPSSFTAAAGNGQVVLQWNATYNNGSAIARYVLHYGQITQTLAAGARRFVATGLANQTGYDFSLYAVNAVGNGAAASVSATPHANLPSAPGAVIRTPTAEEGQWILSWSAANGNGAEVTAYVVYLSRNTNGSYVDFSPYITVNGSAREITMQIDGSELPFIAAQNYRGIGIRSDSNVNFGPFLPENFVAQASDAQVLLSWEDTPNNSDISFFELAYSGTTQTLSSTARGYTATALNNGTTYQFSLRAMAPVYYYDFDLGANLLTNIFSGYATASSTPNSNLPSAPSNLTATAGDLKLTLSWSAANGNGASVTAYIVYVNGNISIVLNSAARSATLQSLSYLPYYEYYNIGVAAQTDRGIGAKATITATPLSAPDVLSDLSAHPRNAEVIIIWRRPSPPPYNTRPTVAYYELAYNGITQTVADAPSLYEQNYIRHTVTGLVNDTRYHFTVRAVNAAGKGEAVSISRVPISFRLYSFSATPGNRLARLSWRFYYHGQMVSHHLLAYNNITQTLALSANQNRSFNHTVAGLANGTRYDFTVWAVGSAGSANITLSATPTGAPGIPLGFYDRSHGNGNFILTWSPPSYNSDAITRYVLTHGGIMVTVPPQPINIYGHVAHTVTQLFTNDTYRFTLWAVNNFGNGPSLTATLWITPPSAPVSLTAVSGNGQAALSWHSPYTYGLTLFYYNLGSADLPRTPLAPSARSYALTGLVNGRTYFVSLHARARINPNSGSSGSYQGYIATIAVTPHADMPSAPSGLVAEARNQQIAMQWSAANGNGASITAYIVYVDGESSLTLGSEARAATLQGLANGATYNVGVAAQNYRGPGANASASAMPQQGAPLAPSSFTAAAGNGQVVLQWNAAYNNGSAIARYVLHYGQITQTLAANARRFVATGLANQTGYDFSLYAVNAVGNGAAASVSVTPHANPPSAPGDVILTPTAEEGQWILSWSAANGNGAEVTAYIVYLSSRNIYGSYVDFSPYITVNGSAREITMQIDGSELPFIAAQNYRGIGVRRHAIFGSFLPESFVAQASDAQVLLSWEDNPDNPDRPSNRVISFFELAYDGATKTLSSTARGYTATALNNGTTYQFSLRAMVSIYDRSTRGHPLITNFFSGYATASSTPNSNLPSAPSNLTATAGDLELTLSWSAANGNGASVTAYIVYVNGNISIVLNGVARSATLQSLSYLPHYEYYNIGVAAQTDRGIGAKATITARPLSAPDVLSQLSAHPRNAEVIITWRRPSPPPYNVQPTVAYYELAYNGITQTVADVNWHIQRHTVTGLVNDTRYHFTVWAVNALGKGEAVSISRVPIPFQLYAFSATPGNRLARLSWRFYYHGQTVSHHLLAYNNITQTLALSANQNRIFNHTVAGLANGTRYDFTVWAVGSAGSASITLSATPTGAPGIPLNPHFRSQGNGNFILTWRWRTSSNLNTITRYVLTHGGIMVTVPPQQDINGRVAHTVTQLFTNDTYLFTLWAVNNFGNGPSVTQTLYARPSAPISLTAVSGNGQAALSWHSPYTYGFILSHYSLESADLPRRRLDLSARSSYALTGLVNGRTYFVSLYAWANSSAQEGYIATIAVTPHADMPSAPSGLVAEARNKQIALQWSAANGNGASVTAYIVYVDGEASLTLGGAARAATLQGLANGATYNVGIAAQNYRGAGANASASAMLQQGAPLAPSSFTAAAGNGQVVLQWNAAYNNGSAIARYVLHYGQITQTLAANARRFVATGLANQTGYDFSLYAVNAVGNGAAASVSATPHANLPSAPASVELIPTVEEGQWVLSWSAANGNSASVTAYIVYVDGEASLTLGGAARAATLQGLANDATVGVAAQNYRGIGPSKSYILAPPIYPPPAVFVAEGRDEQVVLSWEIHDIPSFFRPWIELTYNGMKQTLSSTARGYTVTELNNGATYHFSLRWALRWGGPNDVEFSDFARASATPNSNLPSAPSGLTATARDRELILSWSAANGNGASVTAYLVYFNNSISIALNGEARSATLTNLHQIHNYKIGVAAQTDRGIGAKATLTAIPLAPDKPPLFQALPEDSKALVRWRPPNASYFTVTVTHYELAYNGITQTVGTALYSATDLIYHTVTGLVNGTRYHFTVRAVNLFGKSEAVSTSAVPYIFRFRQFSHRLSVGNGRVYLAWLTDYGNGGTISHYYVAYNNITQTLAPQRYANNHTVTALVNNTKYYFTLWAVGHDYSVSITFSATPTELLSSPRSFSAYSSRSLNANGKIVLNWQNPSVDKDFITRYELAHGGITETVAYIAGNTQQQHTAQLFTNDTYQFTLWAVSHFGNSPIVTAILRAVPSAPISLTAFSGNGQAALFWHSPYTYGSEVLRYHLTFNSTVLEISPDSRNYAVTGLANGTTYFFTLFAKNIFNLRTPWRNEATIAVTPHADMPSAPSGLVAEARNQQIAMQWSAANGNGASVTAYIVYVDGEASLTLGGAARAATLQGLANGATYNVGVAAQNYRGNGANASARAMPQQGAPLAPSSFTAAAGNGQVVLQWNAAYNNGSAIARYELHYGQITQTLAANARRFVATGLANQTGYDFSLYAVNAVGNGAAASVSATPHANLPSPPEMIIIPTTVEGQHILSWGAANGNGAEVTAYIIYFGPRNNLTSYITLNGSAREITMQIDFNVGHPYIAAQNYRGIGHHRTFIGFGPSFPENFVAQASDAQVLLSWEKGSSKISFFELTYDGATKTLSSTARSYTATALNNGTTYQFSLRAMASVYTGGYPKTHLTNTFSDFAKVSSTPNSNLPSAPSGLTATAGNLELTLSWNVANGNGASVTAYIVYVDGNISIVLNGAARSATLQSLYYDENYKIGVAAQTDRGIGAKATITATPLSTPYVLSQLSAWPRNAEVIFSWRRPKSSRPTVAYYELTYNGITQTVANTPAQYNQNYIQHNVTGLVNDTTYHFTLWAVNALGKSEAVSVSRTPKTFQFYNFSATPANERAHLSWHLNVYSGQAVSHHLVAYNNITQTLALSANISGQEFNHTVAGLANGTRYDFTVWAVGSASSASITLSATPTGAPGIPLGFYNRSHGNGSFILAWRPPSSNPDSITRYVLTHGGIMVTVPPQQNNNGNVAHTVTQLFTNDTYRFTLWAVNNFGNGPSLTATLWSKPSAPISLTAVSGNGQAALSWHSPYTYGLTLFSYNLESADLPWTPLDPSARSYALTGLVNGRTYFFSLYARGRTDLNFGSAYGYVATIAVTPHADMPSAPSGLVAEARNQQIAMQWSAANGNGASVTAYIVYVDGEASLTVGGAARAATLQGLANGATYNVGIAAQNYRGAGANTGGIHVVPGTPLAPPSFTVTAGNAQAVLQWGEANSNGAPVLRYELTYNNQTHTLAANARAHTATALANATPYAFVLQAVNSVGDGQPATATATPNADLPGAPRQLNANAGNRVITLSWLPPTNNGGASITAYLVYVNSEVSLTLSHAARAATLLGLANGTTQTVGAQALNYQGGGGIANTTETPYAAPEAPQSIALYPGNGTLTIDWSAPASDNGRPVLSYAVLLANGSNTITILIADASARQTIVSSLTLGQTYAAFVRARNLAGYSPAAQADNTALFAAVPDRATLNAAAGNAQAVLQWGEANSNGAPVLRYELTYNNQTHTLAANARAHTATALANATPYAFVLQAVNSVGDGQPATATATPNADLPGAPRQLNANAGNRVITLSWLPPTNNGGASITAYLVYVNSEVSLTLSHAARAATLLGLANGTTQTVGAQALNYQGGGGIANTTETPYAAPEAPQSIALYPGNGTLTIDWSAPASDNGRPVLSYAVLLANGSNTITILIADASARQTIVSSLTLGQTYAAFVRARNLAGYSPAAQADNTALFAAVPDRATLNAAAGNAQAVLQWGEANSNGASVLRYELTYNNQTHTLAANARAHTATALANATPYAFVLRAVNSVGDGQPATATATPNADLPGAPRQLNANAGNRVITLSWLPPTNNGGASITAYLVYVNSEVSLTLSHAARAATLLGLANGTTQTVGAQALNYQGGGGIANTTETPYAAPEAPQSIALYPGNGTLTIDWSAPASDNGRPVLSYAVLLANGSHTMTILIADASARQTIVSSLTLGQTYAAFVRARNLAGYSPAAQADNTALFAAVPDRATLNAAAGNAQAVLQWGEANSNGASVLRYELTYNNQTHTLAANARAHTATALANATPYAFVLRAVNSVGDGQPATATATPNADLPGAPRQLNANAGNRVITLSWLPPTNNGGASITAYLVYVNSEVSLTLSHAARAATLLGLANGATQTVGAQALNYQGGGGIANTTETPYAAPEAPQSIALYPGNGTLTIDWSAPASDNGRPVLSYAVLLANGSHTMTILIADASARQTIVSSLTLGQTYAAFVRARNLAGYSPAAQADNTALFAAVPDRATLNAAAGNAQAVLQWGEANSNGASVLRYELTYNNQTHTLAANARAHTATALANATPYAFVLRAVNSVGDGQPATATATPNADLPGAPRQLNANAGNRVITLSWLPPTNNGGASITAYLVYVNSEVSLTLSHAARAATLLGLANGATQTVGAQALNYQGGGGIANTTETPYAAPEAPQSIALYPGNGTLTIDWSAPASDNGRPVLSYAVLLANGSHTMTILIADASARQTIVSSLTLGQTYAAFVRARNLAGYSPAAQADNTALFAAVPDRATLNAAAGNAQAVLQWGEANSNGASVLRYELTYNNQTHTLAANARAHTATALANATPYAFVLRAVNSVGDGQPATATATPNADLPGAPRQLNANAGNRVITLSWLPPTNNGGASITAYLVYVNSEVSLTLSHAARAATLLGLANGATQTVGAQALNYQGGGGIANTTETPYAAPEAPQSIALYPGNGTLTIDWSAPASNNGRPVLSYAVLLANGSHTMTILIADASARQTIVSSLTLGQTYAAFVRARNLAGYSPAAQADNTALFAAVPDRATLNAAAGNAQAVLQWGEANSNGASVLRYELTYNNQTHTLAANARAHTATALANATPYAFVLRAVNSVGDGQPATATATPNADLPGAPRQLNANAGNRVITLSWLPPTNNGGASITAYLVYVNSEVSLTLSHAARAATLLGLANGTTQTVGAQALNYQGGGGIANTTETPYAAPEAPQSIALYPGNGTLTIDWSAPASNNGRPVLSYAVLLANGSHTMTILIADASARQTIVSSLTLGQTYAAFVRARNLAGYSPAAQADNTALFAAVPDRATLNAAAGNAQAVLQWGEANSNGASVLRYELTYNNQTHTLAANARAHTATALANATPYAFVLRAVNSVGDGQPATATATPNADLPGAPRQLNANAGNRVITLSWLPPTNNGGASITAYLVYVNSEVSLTLSHAARAATLLGLQNNTAHNLGVAAQNNVGIGTTADTAATTQANKPAAPQNLIVKAGEGAADLTWQAPATDGGASITAYVVYVNSEVSLILSPTARAATLEGLQNNTAHNFGIAAQNNAGIGAIATANATPQAQAPGMPSNLIVSAGNGVITLTWLPPANNGGATITAYAAYLNGAAIATIIARAGRRHTATIAGLANGITHTVGAQALNYQGGGDMAITTETPYTTPAAPQSVALSPGNEALTINWSAPASNNGRPVLAYAVLLANDGDTITIQTSDANARQAVVGSLTLGQTYAAFVRARNLAGYGPAAQADNTALFAGVPSAITDFTANGITLAGNSATLTWQAPDDNGDPLLRYELRYAPVSLATNPDAWASSSITAAPGGVTATMWPFAGLQASVNYRFSLRAVNSLGPGVWTSSYSDPQKSELQKADKAILPEAAMALSKRWTEALGERLDYIAKGAGVAIDAGDANAVNSGNQKANFRAFDFSAANLSDGNSWKRGAAQWLKKHGKALANGDSIISATGRDVRFAAPLWDALGANNKQSGGGAMMRGGIWGGATYTKMKKDKGESPWEGDNIAYYTGIDHFLGSQWLAGFMFSHNRLNATYTADNEAGKGKYDLYANSVHPYFVWTSADKNASFWTSFGYGKGNVKAAKTNRDAKIYSASAGGRRNLWRGIAGWRIDAQADFSAAGLRVDGAKDANSYNLRAKTETSKNYSLSGGGKVAPFAALGARQQKTSNSVNGGLDFSGGFRWNNGGGWSGQLSGAAGALSGGYKEWSIGGVLRKTATGSGGAGLWLELRPQHGEKANRAAKPDSHVALPTQIETKDETTLKVDIGYGILGVNSLWRPYTGVDFGETNVYRAGIMWRSVLRKDLDMRAEIKAQHTERNTNAQVDFSVDY